MWKHRLRSLPWAAYSLAVRILQGGDIVDQEGHKLAGSQEMAVPAEARQPL